MNINNELKDKLSLIVDRYLQLKTPFKNIKKYLLGKNFNIILKELSLIEEMYLIQNKDKNFNDFKKLAKDTIKLLLKDRQYHLLDTKGFDH